MSEPVLQVALEERVLRLTLNRPERRNALNLELCQALLDAFDQAEEDSGVGAILLLANGKAFCSGMDLNEAPNADPALLASTHDRLFTTIERIRKPIVAAVHGAAVAGGTGLVSNAHIVFAGQVAFFGLPEIHVGLWPIMVYRSVALAIGERRTMEWSLTGRRVSAAEAHQAGLVTNLADDPLLEAGAAALSLARTSPAALAAGLRYVSEARGRTRAEASEIGREIRNVLMVQAFQKDRPPP